MTLNTRLILLWAGFLLLSCGLAAKLWADHRDAENQMRLSVRNYSLLLAEHANGSLRAADMVLQGVINDPRFRQFLADKAKSRDDVAHRQLTEALGAFVKTMSGSINFFVADAEGNVLLSAIALPERTNIADREYFSQLATALSDIPVITETVKGRISGKWTIPMARRLVDERGKFLGVVGVSMGVEAQFSRFYDSIDWPEGTAISLWSQQQRLLMRYPMLPDQIGKRSTGNLLDPARRAQAPSEFEVGPSEFDGRIRARAMHRLGQYPIAAIVAVPREHYFADWEASLTGFGVALGLAFLAACLLTVLLRRQSSSQSLLECERALHNEQLESYGKIFDSTQTALALLSPHLRCINANPAFAALVGRTPEQLVGKPILDWFPASVREHILQQAQDGLAGDYRKARIQFEVGEEMRSYTLEVSPIHAEGLVASVVVSLRDITVQSLAEAALKQREAELKAIFDCEPDCVKVCDLDGRLRKINPAGIALLEADNLLHALSINIGALIVDEDRAAYQAFLVQVAGGAGGILQYRGIGLKGSPRHVETHAAPLRDSDGQIVGVLAISRDISRQKVVEAAFEDALEEQRAILDSGIVGLVKVRDRQFVWANDACVNMLGYQLADLIGESIEILIPEQDTNKRVMEAYSRLANGEIWRGKVSLIHRDGSKRWFIAGGRQLRNGDALWALVDITAQHAAEEQLRRSYLAIEQSPDGIVITNIRAEIEYVNQAFTKTTGYSLDELLGQNPRLLHSGRTPPETFVSLWQSLVAGQVWRGEFINRTKSGQDYISQEIIAPVRQADGEITHYLSIKEDVTAQRENDQKLRAYQEELEQMVEERTAELDALYNQAPCGYLSFDANDRITAINDTALGMLGYKRSEVVGRLNIHALLASYETERFEERQKVLLNMGVAHDQDYDFLRKDGSLLPAQMSIEVVRDENGSFVAARSAFYDNRERQAKERQITTLNVELTQKANDAVQANDAKSSFLANMSHEIRTPLNAIIGMSHLLRKSPLSGKQNDQLSKIEAAGEHLLKVISDVLDISKIEAGKLTLEAVSIAPNDLLPCIASLIEQRAIDKGLQLVTDSQPLPYHVEGDLTRLRQALLNLANNAVKFTERGAVTLRMRVLQEAGNQVHLRFEVEDTGPGIPASVLPNLFSAFQQGDNSTTRKHGGTGLGLAITRQLAEKMGGSAGATSEMGRGSQFWFTVWLDKCVEVQTRKRAGSQRSGTNNHPFDSFGLAGRRLLLVEDEPINQEIVREILEDSGFVVDVANNGAEALEQARHGNHSLIVMDMQMPVMDGLTATRQLREHPGLQKTPVIAMTANAFAEDKARCIEAGMNDFMTKPVDPELLISTVSRWIRKVEKHAALAKAN
jgi:two-component system sensor histidine kinase/response regulator